MDVDSLVIADRTFRSRLMVGTARYPSDEVRAEAIKRSGAEIVTASMRRIEGGQRLSLLLDPALFLLPNTAGCHTAKEAIFMAEMAREALQCHWIKLEVIGDDLTLWPDTTELLKAAAELVQKGFVVLPYCTDDVVTCRKLVDVGCSAIMPLASPIGSGQGITHPRNLAALRRRIDLPIIVDAGIGTASDVAIAMELGVDAVLVNTAIAQAQDPIGMATAMKLACQAGRLAYRSGRIPIKQQAQASSPQEGMCFI